MGQMNHYAKMREANSEGGDKIAESKTVNIKKANLIRSKRE
jgi:hypothetical protein